MWVQTVGSTSALVVLLFIHRKAQFKSLARYLEDFLFEPNDTG